MQVELSFYGGWPITPSRKWKGEGALTCPKCKSQRISLTVERGAFGTGPGNRWRMGDQGGRELALCQDCGNKGYHMGIPKAGSLQEGSLVAFSGCRCTFRVAGRDANHPLHVVFTQVSHCKTRACNLAAGQELWLFEDAPIAGVPGKHSFLLLGSDGG